MSVLLLWSFLFQSCKQVSTVFLTTSKRHKHRVLESAAFRGGRGGGAMLAGPHLAYFESIELQMWQKAVPYRGEPSQPPQQCLSTTMLGLQPLAGRCAGARGATPHTTQLEARRLAHRRHAALAAAARPAWPAAFGRRRFTPAAASPSSAFQQVLDETDEEIVGWHWTGSDEFSALDDRRDAPPVPLPPLGRST